MAFGFVLSAIAGGALTLLLVICAIFLLWLLFLQIGGKDL